MKIDLEKQGGLYFNYNSGYQNRSSTNAWIHKPASI